MNRIVRKHFPAERLPQELREGLEGAYVNVTVVVEEESVETKPLELDEIFARRRPPYRTPEEIDASLRQERESWGD